MIRAQAPAKVNLTLEVLRRRSDGYHEIRSLAMFAGFGDQLEISPADGLHLSIDGEFADAAGGGEGNIVLKAAGLLRAECGTGRGAHIHLTKEIPVGAGLGGGSADAAAVLLALNSMWGCHLPIEGLCALAPKLGADVAMCLMARPLLAEGIGECLTLLAEGVPTLHAVLVHPRVPLLTADVYRALKVTESRAMQEKLPPAGLTALEFIEWLATSRNDLEAAALSVSPHVAEVLAALRQQGAPLVRMTGSGACCYALYEAPHDAQRAAAVLARSHPHWWTKVSSLGA